VLGAETGENYLFIREIARTNLGGDYRARENASDYVTTTNLEFLICR